MAGDDLETRALGPDDLAVLASLFQGERNTRHCWCMAFCTSSSRFAVGWLTGGNRRRFESMAASGGPPMGILASVGDEAVGWGACGPRSRYAFAERGRSNLLKDLDRDEDDAVWLVPCLFVRTDFRGQGITRALILAAVELARREGASAIEGWPTTSSNRESADGFLGRESVFEALGFSCTGRPSPDRSVMRLELGGTQQA